MLEKLGGRKAAISLVTVLICVGVVAIKGDVPAGLSDMLKFILGSFIVGNVGADAVAAVAHRAPEAPAAVEAPPAPPVDDGRLESIQTTSEAILEATKLNQQGLTYIVSRIGPPPAQ